MSQKEALSSDGLKIAAMLLEEEPPVGKVIPALGAVDWARSHDVDIRPRLVEPSGEVRLIDSGSQISVTRRRPGDQLDSTLKLIAVNGSRINTYGVR